MTADTSACPQAYKGTRSDSLTDLERSQAALQRFPRNWMSHLIQNNF